MQQKEEDHSCRTKWQVWGWGLVTRTGHEAAGPSSRTGQREEGCHGTGCWTVMSIWLWSCTSEPGTPHPSRTFKKHVSMAGDGLVLLSCLQFSLCIRAQWTTEQGQNLIMPTGVLAFAVVSVGNQPGCCSVTDLCYTSGWPRKATFHCWPPRGRYTRITRC